MCHTCQRFHGTMFERAELMKLKVKDLRDYLHLHEVPTQMCREKEELVELVLSQQTSTPTSNASTPSEMHAHPHLSEQDSSSEPTPIREQPSILNPVTELGVEAQTAEDDQVNKHRMLCFKIQICFWIVFQNVQPNTVIYEIINISMVSVLFVWSLYVLHVFSVYVALFQNPPLPHTVQKHADRLTIKKLSMTVGCKLVLI